MARGLMGFWPWPLTGMPVFGASGRLEEVGKAAEIGCDAIVLLGAVALGSVTRSGLGLDSGSRSLSAGSGSGLEPMLSGEVKSGSGALGTTSTGSGAK